MKRGLHALVIGTALLWVAPAAAAPPPNDNRADAQPLPTFPATAQGTTVEATLERLDPQVSECGRIDATVWYRIDAAPDGRVVVDVQGGAGLAPVVRIYRRDPSAIREIDCGTGPLGGRVVTSFETVRGAGYFILVGRRPGATDGAFEVRAQLHLPPPNDRRGDAQPVERLPASIRGTTLGATGDPSDGRACGLAGATVWYRVALPVSRRMVLRLSVADELDAAVSVYERVRSQLRFVGCAPTDRDGRAVLPFEGDRRATFLVVVGQRRGSDPGDFTLQAVPAEPAESRATRLLPRAGARSTVHGLTDVNDLWLVRLRAGTTYRVGFASDACATLTLTRVGVKAASLVRRQCSAYVVITPGPDGGGRHSLEVRASSASRAQPYRLRVAAAGPDDVGVGLPLAEGKTAHGALAPGGVDHVDVYHFSVERLSEARLLLRRPGRAAFGAVLLTDTGARLGAADGVVRRRLAPGRYVAVVRAPAGTVGGRYALTLSLRDVTSTTVSVDGRRSVTVAPAETLTIGVRVSPAQEAGVVELQIDRFDPLSGWHYHRTMRVPARSATIGWMPPAQDRWRVRATFRGTPGAGPSRSAYVHVLVADPRV